MTSFDANWAVITGSTGGIGAEIARILASRGQNLILLNRSEAKSQAQRAQLVEDHPDLMVEVVLADLMDCAQIASAIDAINAMPGRVEALYNNSGVLTSEHILSTQGFESHFAVNILAPYQLTLGLVEKMARPAGEKPGMVVLFSSSAVNPQKILNLSELAHPKKVTGLMGTYAQSKLAVTALAPALAELLGARNIFIRAIDPGATKTAMTTGGNAAMPKPLQWLAPIFFSAADKQAMKVVDSADPSAFDRRTGTFVANRKERPLPKPIADNAVRERLLAMLNQALISAV